MAAFSSLCVQSRAAQQIAPRMARAWPVPYNGIAADLVTVAYKLEHTAAAVVVRRKDTTVSCASTAPLTRLEPKRRAATQHRYVHGQSDSHTKNQTWQTTRCAGHPAALGAGRVCPGCASALSTAFGHEKETWWRNPDSVGERRQRVARLRATGTVSRTVCHPLQSGRR